MKTTILATLGLLNSAVQASWVVAGYTGQQCTGQELYRHSNPGTIDLWCAGLEYSTATSSVIINVDDDSDRSFEFELHHDGVCQDLNFGHFELSPGMSYCTQTQGAGSVLARAID